MNVEDPNISPNVINIRDMIEENFRLLLTVPFVKEVFEEVVPSSQRETLDGQKIENIVTRCFEIMRSERIETLVDIENQPLIMIRIAFEETESGYLVNDSIFKITGAKNIAEPIERQKANSNNGCIKFSLSNGKEEIFGVEEGKVTDVPQDLTLLDGALLYVAKDTPIRRKILLLSGLNCFIFQSMPQFKQGLNQLTQRIEKHSHELERQEAEKQKKLQAKQDKDKEKQRERERIINQRTAAQSAATSQMNQTQMNMNQNNQMNQMNQMSRQMNQMGGMGNRNQEIMMEDFEVESDMQNMGARQNDSRGGNNNQYNNNQYNNNQFNNNEWYNEEEEESMGNRNMNGMNNMGNMGNMNNMNNRNDMNEMNNGDMGIENQNNNQGQQQISAEECNELLSLLYDDD